MRTLLPLDPILGTTQHIDIGCGRGADADLLNIMGWDPVHRPHPEGLRDDYEVGTMIYVLNTLPEEERVKAVAYAFGRFNLWTLYVVVRDDREIAKSNTQYKVEFDAMWHSMYSISELPEASLPGRFKTYLFETD